MERREPTFVPEWLKSSGSGSTRSHQATPSLASSADHIALNSTNVSSTRVNGKDAGRTPVSIRTTSAYFRRSSSSNGYPHSRSNSSYGRSNRDTEWDKETLNSRSKDESLLGGHRRRDYSDDSERRFDKDLRRSQSMLNGKRGKLWTQNDSADTNNAYKGNSKDAFQRDFPSLRGEGRQGFPEIRRVSSPIQSLPVISGDGWTSALAKVNVSSGNNGISGSPRTASSNGSGLSMAETLAQGPRADSTSPRVPIEAQKVEEPVKHSRQLVPLTSSVPKSLVYDPSENLKPKIGQQISYSSSSNHFTRGGLVKSDVSRTSSIGKLSLLKPEREGNGVYPTLPSPTNGSIASTSANSSSLSSTLATAEHKPTTSSLEKRPSSHAKSRSDFFNLMRKKSVETPNSAVSPSDLDKDSDSSSSGSLVGDKSVDKKDYMKNEGDISDSFDKSANDCGKDCSNFKAIFHSEEKEINFLRSLGWEEPEGDDGGGLTEEEINSFHKDLDEQIKSRPSLGSLQKMQLKFSRLLNDRRETDNGGGASGSSLSEVKLEP